MLATENRRQLNDDSEGGVMMRSVPTQDRHVPLWNKENQDWVPGHGRMSDLEDVQMGSKKRPLEEGDIFRYERGRVVNARDRALEQELGHHIDTKFGRDLADGDIIIRNETAGLWSKAPLRAFLQLAALSDVQLDTKAVPHESILERDAEQGRWVVRRPKAQAWLRFCADPQSDRHKTWGRVDHLNAGRWSSVRPVSPSVGVYAINIRAKGGLRISRKHVSIRTVPVDQRPGGRPSATGKTYRLRAHVSAAGLPPGTWGFLVGNEPAPLDGGFAVTPPEDVRLTAQWTIESVRDIQLDQEIRLAYRPERTPLPANPPLIQCMTMGVEEM